GDVLLKILVVHLELSDLDDLERKRRRRERTERPRQLSRVRLFSQAANENRDVAYPTHSSPPLHSSAVSTHHALRTTQATDDNRPAFQARCAGTACRKCRPPRRPARAPCPALRGTAAIPFPCRAGAARCHRPTARA